MYLQCIRLNSNLEKKYMYSCVFEVYLKCIEIVFEVYLICIEIVFLRRYVSRCEGGLNTLCIQCMCVVFECI